MMVVVIVVVMVIMVIVMMVEVMMVTTRVVEVMVMMVEVMMVTERVVGVIVEVVVVKVVLVLLMSLVWVVTVVVPLIYQSLRSSYPPAPLLTQKVCPACITVCAMVCVMAPVCLDLYEHVPGHFDISTSKVYKAPKAFKIKIGVKPFGSSKLERINEPPSCSYRQLM